MTTVGDPSGIGKKIDSEDDDFDEQLKAVFDAETIDAITDPSRTGKGGPDGVVDRLGKRLGQGHSMLRRS